MGVSPVAGRSALRDAADVALLMLGGAVVLLVTIWLALRTGVGARADQEVIKSFRVDRFNPGRISALLREIQVSTIFVLTLIAVAVIALQRHWRAAVALPILVVGANQSTQLLKLDFLTSVPTDPSVPVTLPSGHATAAVSLAAVAIIASPRVVRPIVCLLTGTIAGAAGLGTMAERWHRPADVIAAVGVVLIWSAIAVLIGAHWVDQPLVRPAGFDRAVGHSALACLGVAIGVYLLHRLGMQPMDGSKAHTLAYGSLIVVGVTIGLGLGVIAVVADRRIFRSPVRIPAPVAPRTDAAAVPGPGPAREQGMSSGQGMGQGQS